MLATSAVIEAVAEGLKLLPGVPVVLDPVMVAASGDVLLDKDAIATLKRVLLPRAIVITPNLPEAAQLLGAPQASDEDEMRAQARELKRLGAKAVLIKGGHAKGASAVDLLLDGEGEMRLEAPRVPTKQRPWHRLHALFGDRRRARQRRLAARGGGGGQGLCHRSDRRGRRA